MVIHMQVGTILSEADGELSVEKFKVVLQRKEQYNVRDLRQEYERLDHLLQYTDCFRLWDLAEAKYHWGLVCYLLAQSTREKHLLKNAREAFNFVINTEHYRHSNCTTQILERLIYACDNP